MVCKLKRVLILFLMSNSLLQAKSNAQPLNIILIINDQERYQLETPSDFKLPARETFAQRGIRFRNHYAAAAMCSPSRAAFLTGTTPQVNGVFDQMGYKFVNSLPSTLPNMGSILKSLGYQTAYFGKFEMDKSLLQLSDTVNSSTLIQQYGFDTFNPDGDMSGNALEGYQRDAYFVGQAIRWIREVTSSQEKSKKPFFLVLSLLNPHDIMYGDANLPGGPVIQKSVATINPPPKNSLYTKRWNFTLPTTLKENIKAPGVPSALSEYLVGWSSALGFIPSDQTEMWRSYYNYYLNALRDNDSQLQKFVQALDELDLWQKTVVVLTADHGEMGGAHGGLRGKGPFVYEQNAHIPLIIDHPQGMKGQSSFALTSHLDLLPTLVHLTGLSPSVVAKATAGLKGRDFSSLLKKPDAGFQAIRPAILFNYVGISTIDHAFLAQLMEYKWIHKSVPILTDVNLNMRGFLAFVFDGRYKFGRYYAPNGFNTPKTLDEIFKYNDVQLFDLQTDPEEKVNLAQNKEVNRALILRMNALLNQMMQIEVGENNGQFLPESIRPKI